MAESGLGRRRLLCLIVGFAFVSFLPVGHVDAEKKSDTVAGKYTGPGSCSASSCHGEAQPINQRFKDQTRRGVLQNESFIWATRDPHFGSYNALQSDRSKQMMRILQTVDIQDPSRPDKWKQSAVEEPRCRACHALTRNPSEMLNQARYFEDEGISCESCHGAASGWLGNHFLQDWTTAKSLQSGLYPIDDAVQRAKLCLGCHLGKDGQEVDHQMIAAGHPDLFFEMDLFSAKEPRHWEEPPDWTEPALRQAQKKEPGPWGDSTHDPNYKVRLWAVGQAVQLREALNRLKRRADHGQWPEFSELDCFSCHHSIRSNLLQPPYEQRTAGWPSDVPDSWRQKRGYAERIAGSPPWNNAHYTVFLIMLKTVDPENATQLESKLDALFKAASKTNSSSEDIKTKVNAAAGLAEKTVATVNRRFDKPTLAQLLLNISSQGDLIADRDTRSAEQAYMALDSLFRCYDDKIKAGAPLHSGTYRAVGSAIDDLYHQFDNPSAYNAPRFADGMRKVNAALRAAGIAHSPDR